MEAVNLVIAILVAIGSMLVGVITVVWAVAQIKETTSNLGIEIRHLAKEITSLRDNDEDHEARIRELRDNDGDHEARIRVLERKPK